MDSFLKIFRIQLFSKVSYVGRLLCTRLKFGICDIYFTQNLFIFYVNSIWYNRLITAETIIWFCLSKRNICFILQNYVLLLSLFLVINTANISKVVSMLFSQRWSNADEQTQLSFSTKYNCLNSIDLLRLNQRNSFNVVSTLFYVETTSINIRQLNFHFQQKFHRWNNVVLSTLNRCIYIDDASTLFCQRWNNVDKCTSAQLSLSTKYQRRDNFDDQRCFSVESTLVCLLGFIHDENWPFKTTLCLQFFKKSVKRHSSLSFILFYFDLHISPLCQALWKALDMCRNIHLTSNS